MVYESLEPKGGPRMPLPEEYKTALMALQGRLDTELRVFRGGLREDRVAFFDKQVQQLRTHIDNANHKSRKEFENQMREIAEKRQSGRYLEHLLSRLEGMQRDLLAASIRINGRLLTTFIDRYRREWP